MSGDRQQINLEFIDMTGDLAGGLRRVTVKQSATGMGDIGQFSNGLNGPRFVIGMHNTDQTGVRAHGCRQARGADTAVVVDREVCDVMPLTFQPAVSSSSAVCSRACSTALRAKLPSG